MHICGSLVACYLRSLFPFYSLPLPPFQLPPTTTTTRPPIPTLPASLLLKVAMHPSVQQTDSQSPERQSAHQRNSMVLPGINTIIQLADDAARPHAYPSVPPLSSMGSMSQVPPFTLSPLSSAHQHRTARYGPAHPTRHVSPPVPHPPRRAKKYPCTGCNSVFERPSSLKQVNTLVYLFDDLALMNQPIVLPPSMFSTCSLTLAKSVSLVSSLVSAPARVSPPHPLPASPAHLSERPRR